VDSSPKNSGGFSDPIDAVHFLEEGRGGLIVFLHGLFDASPTWHRLFPELSSQFHLVALDLPGFGKTRLPAPWRASLSETVAFVLRFLDRWRGERPTLVGSSMGGGLVLALASAAPERFDRLVLLNPYAVPVLPWIAQLAKNPLAGALFPLFFRGPFGRLWVKRIFNFSLANPAHLAPSHLGAVMEPFQSYSRRLELIRFLRGIDPAEIRGIDESLPSLPQKVLLLWGVEDRWLPPRHPDRIASRLLRCRRINVPHCGHLPHLDRPLEVAAEIRAFLLSESSGSFGPRASGG